MISVSTLQSQQLTAMPQDIKNPAAITAASNQAGQTQAAHKVAQQSEELPAITQAQTSMSYVYDAELNGAVIKLLAKDKSLIKQIPPEEAVKLYKFMSNLIKEQAKKANS